MVRNRHHCQQLEIATISLMAAPCHHCSCHSVEGLGAVCTKTGARHSVEMAPRNCSQLQQGRSLFKIKSTAFVAVAS